MKNTKVFSINPDDTGNEALEYCAGIIRNGGTVAFPTETVYGLGSNALDEEAVGKIFAAKGRPSDNPLILHIHEYDDMYKYAAPVPETAEMLAKLFWPGPISMILGKKDIIPGIVTGGLDTVAFRIPANQVALKLIGLAGVPVAAPSANLSGKPSPTDGSHVIEDLFGRVDAIIDTGKCPVGLESTVLDLVSDPPAVLRPGGIPFDRLKMILPGLIRDYTVSEEVPPRSPGMKYRHYSPDARLVIVKGSSEKAAAMINELTKKSNAGILCSSETAGLYPARNRICAGSRYDSQEIAANIFDSLRMFDKLGVDTVYSEYFGEGPMGDAIMNRLLKAASHRVVDLDE